MLYRLIADNSTLYSHVATRISTYMRSCMTIQSRIVSRDCTVSAAECNNNDFLNGFRLKKLNKIFPITSINAINF